MYKVKHANIIYRRSLNLKKYERGKHQWANTYPVTDLKRILSYFLLSNSKGGKSRRSGNVMVTNTVVLMVAAEERKRAM
jgi:hypothetical protein